MGRPIVGRMVDRFAVVADEHVLCTAHDVDGFFVDAAPGRRTFHLAGATPVGPARLAKAELRVVDDAGAAIGAYHLGDVELGPDAVTATVFSRTHALAGRMWDLWRRGPLTERDTWAPYPTPGREAWLEVARVHATSRPVATGPPPDPLRLLGAAVTDRPGLFCALGEAANGPGGYYGANLDALHDCLRGGFGPTPPFQLLWHDAAVAERHVPDLPAVLDVLAEAGVEVVPR